MTACMSVIDVLRLSPNPAKLSRNAIRKAFGGGGWERITVVHKLAIERHTSDVRAIMALGVNRSEAEAWLGMVRG